MTWRGELTSLHLQLRYQKAWDSVIEAAFKEVLGLRISKSHHGTRPPLYAAAMSKQGEACHPCVLRMLNTLQELKSLKTIEELQANFVKPRPPMIGCLSPSCQYTSIFTKLLLRMKSDIAEIPSFSPSFNWSKPELTPLAQDSSSVNALFGQGISILVPANSMYP
jgi:hypothetical protein